MILNFNRTKEKSPNWTLSLIRVSFLPTFKRFADVKSTLPWFEATSSVAAEWGRNVCWCVGFLSLRLIKSRLKPRGEAGADIV